MALDPARRRRNLPTGDLKARLRISPGLPTTIAISSLLIAPNRSRRCRLLIAQQVLFSARCLISFSMLPRFFSSSSMISSTAALS